MRGGKREGAGRPKITPDKPKLENWTVRVHEEEKPLVRQYLKQLRKQNEKENK